MTPGSRSPCARIRRATGMSRRRGRFAPAMTVRAAGVALTSAWPASGAPSGKGAGALSLETGAGRGVPDFRKPDAGVAPQGVQRCSFDGRTSASGWPVVEPAARDVDRCRSLPCRPPKPRRCVRSSAAGVQGPGVVRPGGEVGERRRSHSRGDAARGATGQSTCCLRSWRLGFRRPRRQRQRLRRRHRPRDRPNAGGGGEVRRGPAAGLGSAIRVLGR